MFVVLGVLSTLSVLLYYGLGSIKLSVGVKVGIAVAFFIVSSFVFFSIWIVCGDPPQAGARTVTREEMLREVSTEFLSARILSTNGVVDTTKNATLKKRMEGPRKENEYQR